jgi:NAD(P)-dependent dehydrogenase (short-subunit alcohol dehydrogenase family)
MKQLGIQNFSGKRIWLIGASSGIGEACAKAFIAKGAKVALSSRRVEPLQKLAASAAANQTVVVPVDVTKDNQINEAYQQILQIWGGVDLLLFVSGVYTPLRANNFDFKTDFKAIGPVLQETMEIESINQQVRSYSSKIGFDLTLPIYLVRGAQYIISRTQVMKRPKEFYEKILETLSHEVTPWAVYDVEKCLFQIFGVYKPIDN